MTTALLIVILLVAPLLALLLLRQVIAAAPLFTSRTTTLGTVAAIRSDRTRPGAVVHTIYVRTTVADGTSKDVSVERRAASARWRRGETVQVLVQPDASISLHPAWLTRTAAVLLLTVASLLMAGAMVALLMLLGAGPWAD
jgi:hypothetical protein